MGDATSKAAQPLHIADYEWEKISTKFFLKPAWREKSDENSELFASNLWH